MLPCTGGTYYLQVIQDGEKEMLLTCKENLVLRLAYKFRYRHIVGRFFCK